MKDLKYFFRGTGLLYFFWGEGGIGIIFFFFFFFKADIFFQNWGGGDHGP
jgi:hypothetical protein